MIVIGVHQEPREFPAKFKLAHLAALRFGSAALCRTSLLPDIARQNTGHVIFEMALTPNRAQRFSDFRDQGHHVVTFDEEASAAVSIPEARLHPDAVENTEGLVSWGPRHQALLDGRVPEKKIIHSGHPRLEVCLSSNLGLFEFEMREIRKIAPFVLWVTDTRNYAFERVNDAYSDYLVRLSQKVSSECYEYEPMSREAFYSQFDELRKRLDHQARLFEMILDQTDLKVVVRPRVTVSVSSMRQQLRAVGFRDSRSVTITNEFSVTPWIASAALVVQHGCTTSIESAIAQTPVRSFPASPSRPLADIPFALAPGADAVDDSFAQLFTDDDDAIHRRFRQALDSFTVPRDSGSSELILNWLESRFADDDCLENGEISLKDRSRFNRTRSATAAGLSRLGLRSKLPSQRSFDKPRLQSYMQSLNALSLSNVRFLWHSRDFVVFRR